MGVETTREQWVPQMVNATLAEYYRDLQAVVAAFNKSTHEDRGDGAVLLFRLVTEHAAEELERVLNVGGDS